MDANLRPLVCALADDEHFLRKPVTLLCGHAVCFTCVESTRLTSMMKCEICGKENRIDLDVIAESPIASSLITINMNELVNSIRSRFEVLFSDFKGKLFESSEHLDVQIRYAKEEIDIKVESLKAELDELKFSLINELAELRNELNNSVKHNYTKNYQECLDQLTKFSAGRHASDLAQFNKFQSSLKELKETVKLFSNFNPQVTFSHNSERLSSKLIGSIGCNFANLLKRINSDNYEIIDLDYEIRGICTLDSSNCLLAASSKHHCLTLFDDNMKVLRTVDHIDYKSILPRYVATNGHDKIYIVQSSLNKITLVDFEFNFLKEFGSEGATCSHFDLPLGVCFHQDSLYVCDSLNKRIQRLSENLLFLETFQVDFKPWEIKINGDYACIRPNGIESIFVYSLKPFRVLNTISNGNGAIFNFNFWYYELSLLKHICCYDATGKLIDMVSVDVLKDIDINDGQVALEYFNGKFLISCKKAKKLILLN